MRHSGKVRDCAENDTGPTHPLELFPSGRADERIVRWMVGPRSSCVARENPVRCALWPGLSQGNSSRIKEKEERDRDVPPLLLRDFVGRNGGTAGPQRSRRQHRGYRGRPGSCELARLAVADGDPALGCQLFEAHGAVGVDLAGGDADFGAEAELEAVVEAGGGVHEDAG